MNLGLGLAGAGGLAIIVLSLFPAWLAHDRVLLGEGPRHVHTELGAWTSQSVPVLGAGVLLVVLAGILAATRLAGVRRVAPSWVFLAACAGSGLLAAGLPTISQSGHASGVSLSAGWALPAGVLLALLTAGSSLVANTRRRRLALIGLVLVVVLGAGGWGARQLELNLAEGTGRHYSQGSYTRQAILGEPTETLTFTATTISVGDRWSGTYEGSGRVVSISGDPACPDVRASYHVDSAGNGGITWEMIIDTCADGARAKDLTTGTWALDH